jgi:hypothetical protein
MGNESQDARVNVNKNRSLNLTTERVFKKSRARIACYNEIGLKPRSLDSYPRLDVVAGDDLPKFQRGLIRFTIQERPGERPRHYFVHLDAFKSGLDSVIKGTYGIMQ